MQDFRTSQPDFADDSGECLGLANSGPGGIFSGNYTSVKWTKTTPGLEVPVSLEVNYPKFNHSLVGHMAKEQDRMLYITSGNIDDSGAKISSGGVREKAGGQRGPFLFQITLHRNFIGIADGYTFHVIGWVFKETKA